MVIKGKNFSPHKVKNAVFFHDKKAKVLSATTKKIIVIVPGGATTGSITVRVENRTAESKNDFKIKTPKSGGGDGKEDNKFIRRQGKSLVVGKGGKIIQFQGINVQNFWLVNPDFPSDPFFNDDEDKGIPIFEVNPERFNRTVVKNIADMGMNVIRNELNYRQFEDNANPYVYKKVGWDALDKRIAWAKRLGIYTIIDLHVPQGGLQGQVGPAVRLWDNPELRKRAKTLWLAIARRYKDEPWVAAYDLINEPTPSKSPKQWASFAQEIVNEICTVDRNHLIIIEEITSVVDAKGNYPEIDPNDPLLPLVKDDNVMYDFHFYEPREYVMQMRSEVGRGDGGKYPDNSFEYIDHDGTLIGVRNKAYLETLLKEKLNFQKKSNVPINIGEFSPGRVTFLNNNAKGGFDYVTDILSLFNKYGLSYQYFTYLTVFFEGWEYDENPELRQVTRDLKKVFQRELKKSL